MCKNIFDHFLTIFYQIYRKYIFLKKEDLDGLIEILIKQITNSGYKPDIVVAILEEGLYPAKIISKQLNVELAKIGCASYSLKILDIEMENFPVIKRIAKFFGYRKKIRLTKELDKDIKNKKVLIVDIDSVEGKTMEFIINKLRKYKPKEIKTAVLCLYHNFKFIDFSAVKVYQKKDIEKRHRAMPWVKISPYYCPMNQFISSI